MTAKPKENLLPLKILVISLGFVLLGGFVFVVASVIGGLGKAPSTACADAVAELPVRGKIEHVASEKGRWQVAVRTPEGFALITLDGCTGKTLHTLTLTPPGAR